jgi:hypothetical protein
LNIWTANYNRKIDEVHTEIMTPHMMWRNSTTTSTQKGRRGWVSTSRRVQLDGEVEARFREGALQAWERVWQNISLLISCSFKITEHQFQKKR